MAELREKQEPQLRAQWTKALSNSFDARANGLNLVPPGYASEGRSLQEISKDVKQWVDLGVARWLNEEQRQFIEALRKGQEPPSPGQNGGGERSRDPHDPSPSPSSPRGGKAAPMPRPSRDYGILKQQMARATVHKPERTLKRFEDRHPEPEKARTAEHGKDTTAGTPAQPPEPRLKRFEDRHPSAPGREIER